MVNQEDGQLYTIEGIAASVLLILTVYIVLSTTTILTPGDTHIIDLQLEQVGNDVLMVLDTPGYYNDNTATYSESNLTYYVHYEKPIEFKSNFTSLANTTTIPGHPDRIKFNATVYYRNMATQEIKNQTIAGDQYFRENAVKVSRWIYVDASDGTNSYLEPRSQTVLLEVLLWRE